MIRYLTALSLIVVATVQATAAEPSTALPESTASYIHINVAKLWDSPIGKAIAAKSSPEVKKSLAELKADFGMTPEMFDTITITQSWTTTGSPTNRMMVQFRQTYKRAMVIAGLKKHMQDFPSPVVGDNEKFPKYEDDGKILTVYASSFVTLKVDMSEPKSIAVSMLIGVETTPAQPAAAKKDGPLTKVVALADAKDSLFTYGMNFAAFPVMLSDDDPQGMEPFVPLLKCEIAWLNAKLTGDTITFDLHAQAENARKAKDAERSLGVLRLLIQSQAKTMLKDAQASKELPMASVATFLEKIMPSLNAMAISVEGKEAIMKGSLPATLDFQPLCTLMLIETSSDSGMQMRPSPLNKHLEQVGLAIHNYHDAMSKFPTAANFNKPGKPLLSWRVHVLPFLDEGKLYKQFHLDEPWDSEHNMKVMNDNPMPSAYTMTKKVQPNEMNTHIQAFVGKDTIISPTVAKKVTDITDGTVDTLMLGVAVKAVPWTKPVDIDVDGKADVLSQLLFNNGITSVCFGDGSVRTIKKTIKPTKLKALITSSGGEVVSIED